LFLQLAVQSKDPIFTPGLTGQFSTTQPSGFLLIL
jgi:hypothetical protein